MQSIATSGAGRNEQRRQMKARRHGLFSTTALIPAFAALAGAAMLLAPGEARAQSLTGVEAPNNGRGEAELCLDPSPALCAADTATITPSQTTLRTAEASQILRSSLLNGALAPQFTIMGNTITYTDGEVVNFGFGNSLGNTIQLSIASGSATQAGVLFGRDGVEKIGAGTIILTSTNTYSGATAITAGTLQIGNGGTTGTLGGGNVVNNAALVFNRSNDLSVSNIISGTGTLTKLGAGTLTLTGENTYSGGTAISAGTLALHDGGTLGSGGVDNNAALTFNIAADMTFGNRISGTGSLTKLGVGNLTLTGANTYTGVTTVSQGTLTVSNASALGTTAGRTVVADGATLAFNGVFSLSEALTINGNGVNGQGALRSVFGNRSFFGEITLGSAARINSDTFVNISGGISSRDFDLTLDGNNANSSISVLSQLSLGTGKLIKDGSGVVRLISQNVETSGLIINNGLLILGDFSSPANAFLPDSASVTINGGRLTLITSETIGSLSGSAAAELFDNTLGHTLTVAGDASTEFAGTIGGTLALTKQGIGTLTLTGASSSSGTTTISGGTLQIGDGGTAGSLGSGNVVNNAALVFNRSNDFTVDPIISGTGSLTKLGAGTLTLAGNNTYSGTTTITAGTLQIGNGGTTGTLGSGIVVNNAALVFNRSNDFTVANAISGSGTLTKQGAGQLTLAGAGSYSGLTTIAAGDLIIGNFGTTGSVGTGDVVNNGRLIFRRSNDITVGNVISGTGIIAQQGAGTLTLTGNNTFTGGVGVANGTLRISADANLGVGRSLSIILGGTLSTSATFTMDRAIGLGTGGAVVAPDLATALTLTGPITGAGALTKAGGGTLLIARNTGTTFSGDTFVNGGALFLSGIAALGTGNITVGGSTRLGAFGNATLANQLVMTGAASFESNVGAALTLTGPITGGQAATFNGTVVLAGDNSFSTATISTGSTLTIGNGGASGTLGSGNVVNNGALVFNRSNDFTVGNIISGTGSLTKQGAGNLTLSGANTFTGLTTVSAGTLTIANAAALGTAAAGTIVNSGATLAFSDLSTLVREAITLNGSGVGNRGALLALGSTTFSGEITLASASRIASEGRGFGPLGFGGGIRGSNHDLTIGGAGSVFISSPVSLGTGRLIKDGPGTFGLFNTNALVSELVIEGGVVQLGTSGSTANAALADLARVTVNTGTLALGLSETIGSLAGNAAAVVTDSGSGQVLTVGGNNLSTLFAGSFTNRLQLTKVGTGTLTLTGASTNTGTVTINGGTLQIGNGGTTGALGSGNVVNNALLVFDRSNDVTVGNMISGTGSLTKAGAGTLTLSGANTYSGGTAIVAGTLVLVDGGTLGSGGVDNNAALTFNIAADMTFGNRISGTGSLTKRGLGNLTLTGASIYSGQTTVAQGTLTITGGPALGFPTGNTIVASGATLALAGDGMGLFDAVTLNGNGANSGGALQLVSGSTTVSGAITLGSAARINSNSVPPRSLTIQGGITGAGFDLTTGGTGVIAIGGPVSLGGGRLIKDGSGALLLRNTNAQVSELVVGGGQVQLGVSGDPANLALADTTRVTLNEGTLVLRASETIGSLAGSAISFVNDDGLNRRLTVGGNNLSTLFAGRLIGPLGLTKEGTGTLTLTGANTNSDPTIISGGTLQIGNGGVSGTLGTGNVVNNAALVFNRRDNVTIANAISGTGILTKLGGSTLTLTGTNTYSGGTIISGGVLEVGNFGTTGTLGTGNVVNNGALRFMRSNDITVAGDISGTGVLTKMGAGTLTLSGANTFSGGTTIVDGTLALQGGNALANSVSVNLGARATLQLLGSEQIRGIFGAGQVLLGDNRLTIAQSFNSVFSGVISGSGGLTKSGSGSLTLTGANTFTGLTTVLGDMGQLFVDTTGSLAGAVDVRDRGYFVNSGTVGGLTTVDLGGELVSSGTLLGGLVNNGRSDVSGLVMGAMITSGSLNAGRTLTVTGAVVQNSGFIGLNDSTVSIGSLAGTGVLSLIAASSLTVGSDNTSTTYSGEIQGLGPLIKVGAGTLTLDGANSFGGGVTIDGGTLRVANPFALGRGRVQIGSGASLAIDVPIQPTFTNSIVLADAGSTILSRNSALTGTVSGGQLNVGALDGTNFLVLAGNNTYGATNLAARARVQVGFGGTSGTLGTGAVTLGTGSVLTFVRSDNQTVSNVISGSGALQKFLGNTLTLTGSNTAADRFTGAATVVAGTLLVNGTFGDVTGRTATIRVVSGARLGGSGTIAGNVFVNSGGILSPGTSPGTLAIAGNLSLSGGSLLNFELAQAGVIGGGINDLITVGGNLTLAGTANIIGLPGFGEGIYRIINYGGTLTNTGFRVGTRPDGFSASLITSVAGQVSVQFIRGLPSMLYWDGPDATGISSAFNGNGGAGIWSSTGTNWTFADGFSTNLGWGGQTGIFGGAAGGIVQVSGDQAFQQLRFATGGYTLTAADAGGSLVTTGGTSIIDVATGLEATINVPVTGSAGLTKAGAGVLTLGGVNTYSGLTSIAEGTLVLTAGGAIAGAVENNATFTNAGTITGAVTNGGTLASTGIILGGLTNNGTATLSGRIDGGIANAGTITLGSTSLRAVGAFTQTAGGVFDLNGRGAALGSLAGDGQVRIGTGTLTIGVGSSTGAGTFAGVISGTGALNKNGAGTLTLTGVNTFTGVTSINFGELAIAAGASLGGEVLNSDRFTNGGTVGGLVRGFLGATTTNTGTITGAVTNGGTLASTGIILGGLTNNGTATLSGRIDGGIANAGTITLGSTSLRAVGAFTQTAGGVFDLNGRGAALGSLAGDGQVRIGTGTLTIGVGSSTGAGTFAGVISGTGALNKNGTGTLTLTGVNTFTGVTSINFGELAIAAGASLGGEVLNSDRFTNAGTFGGLVRGFLGATTTNTGTITGAVINGGTLVSTGSILGNLSNSGTATLSGGVNGAVSNSGTITLAGITTGIGAFSQEVGGSLNLAGFDTTLGSLAGSGAVQLGSATLTTGGDGSSSGFDGSIAGTGGLTKTGGGTFTLSGANAYDGLTTVSEGVLAVGNAAGLGSAAGGTLIADGAALHLQGGLLIAGEALTLNGNGVAGTGALRNLGGDTFWGGTITLASDSSIIADAGRLDISLLAGGSQGLTTGGAGLVGILDATTTGTLTVTGGSTSLFGNGSFAGGVTVTDGALFLQGGTSIADSAAVNLIGGTLVVSRSETIGSLAATGGSVQIDGGQTLTFGGNDASTTFAGQIFNTGNLVKQGAGTFTVTGRLLHTGTTAINGGTLLSGAADIWQSNGAVTIAAGGTLDLGGFAQNIAAINLAGGTLANGVLAGAITSGGGMLRDVTGANSLLATGGTTLLTGTGSFAQGVTLAGGNVTLQGAGSRIADMALVTINAGTLGVDGSETIGALAGSGGQVRIAANQTLTTGGNGANTTYAGVITGSGNLTKSGAGVMTLGGVNTLSGLTTVGAGTLALTAAASLAGPVQNNAGLTNAGTIGGLVTNAATLLSSGSLNGGLVNSGSAGLAGQLNGTVANSGLVQLQGALTGITAFEQTADGRFDLANIGISIGSLAGGGTVSLGAAILTLGGSNASTSFGGTISGSGGLVKTGSGTFTLTGGQAFTGLTTVSGGTLAITGTGGLSGSVLNNATLQSAGVLLGGLTNNGTAVLAGRIDGGIANSGLITLSGLLRANGAFTQAATGVLDLAGSGALLGSLAGEGQVRIGSGILTTGTDNTSTIFAGVISGTGAFTKLGTGTLTLTGVNTFSGLTTIDSGTLVIGEGASPAAATSATATTGRVLAVTAEAAPAIVSLAAAPAAAPVATVPTMAHLADAKATAVIAADAESGRPSLAAGFGLGNGLGAAVIAPASASAGVLTGGAQPDLGNNMATASIVGGGATVTITDRGADQAADLATGPVSDAALAVPVPVPVIMTTAAAAPGADPVAMTAAALPSRAVLAGDVLNNAALINNGTILGRVINSAGATAVNNGTIRGPVGNAGTFTSIGTLSGGLSNTGTARLRGVVTGEVFNAGSITLTGATTGMTVLNQTTSGRFDLGGFDTAIGVIAGGGTINLGSARLTTGTNDVNSLFEGVIAGSGSLFKAGTGGLILSGDNLYTGGTTIAAGVLQIGNGGTTGSILGAVVNNGTLIVNRSNAYTLAGAISGTGTFVQAGSGTTTLTGANTYTGGTLVSGGRLIGSTTALQGLIQNDAALEFAQAANGLFAGRIFGSGLLDKSGAGLLEMTGDNSGLRGATTVRAGELRVTGSLAGSATTVLSGATLSGNGTLGGLIARSGATIAPGADGLGMLGVNGAIQLQSGSSLRLQVQAANGSDMLIGNGTLQVGGTAAISNLGGTFAFNSNYLLLQASGGRTGTFDAVTGLSDFGILYRPELVYTNTQVLLRMAPNLLANIVGTTPLTFNQRSVVSRIDAAMTAGYNPQPLFAIYTLAAAQQVGAFDQLSGESYTTAAGVGVEQERLVREAVLGRVAAVAAAARLSPEAGTGPGAWGQVLRTWGDGDSDGNAARHESDRDGFITGIDYGTASSDRSWRAGAYGFHMTNRVRVNAVGSRVALNQTGGGIYAAASFGGLSFGLGGSLAGVDLASQRNIALPGFTETNRGFTNGRAIQTFAEVSYTIAAGKATFRPFVGGAAGQLRLDALTESGGAAALSVGRQRFDSASVTAGADGSVSIGKILQLSGTVAGRMQIGERDPVAQIALAAAPAQAFAIRGIQLDRFALATRLDATVALSRNADLSLGYTGLIGKETTDHGARATISVRF